MKHVSVREELEAPVAAVWSLIRDFGEVSAWAPDAQVASIEGEGAGAVRRIETEMGLFVERCPEHDDAGHPVRPEAHLQRGREPRLHGGRLRRRHGRLLLRFP